MKRVATPPIGFRCLNQMARRLLVEQVQLIALHLVQKVLRSWGLRYEAKRPKNMRMMK